MELNKIHHIDTRQGLKQLPDRSVNCCVTSPPYWALRDYGTGKWIGGNENCKHSMDKIGDNSTLEGGMVCVGGDAIYRNVCKACGAIREDQQIGMEATPSEYVSVMVEVFEQVRRVLTDDGTCWINIGDTYYGGKGTNGASVAYSGNTRTINREALVTTAPGEIRPNDRKIQGLKPKDLVGIPWMLAFALRDAGWYLRQDLIWHKPNPMPESVTDRCTKSHEYLFLLSKSREYYYDAYAIATPYKDKTLTTFGCEVKGNGDGSGLIKSENWHNSVPTRKPKVWKNPDGWDTGPGAHGSIHRDGRSKGKTAKDKLAETYGLNGSGFSGHSGNYSPDGKLIGSGRANKRSVWTVATEAFKEAHFATFPPALIADCILAGCPENGVVLDPFMGAGTTAIVARKLNRNFIGFELNADYIKIANKRLRKELGLFHP